MYVEVMVTNEYSQKGEIVEGVANIKSRVFLLQYMKYDDKKLTVIAVDGIPITLGKHAYCCSRSDCLAIWETGNFEKETLFATTHPQCYSCNHKKDMLQKLCEC